MATDTKSRIEELITKATESLGRSAVFETERMAVKALSMARHASDFITMARIVKILRDARQQRLKQAQTTSSGGKGRITMLKAPVTEDMRITRGCYIVSPPQVGADARRLRLAAFEAEVPLAVVCREPRTTIGLVPVVAISAGATVRVKIDPPASEDKPGIEWFNSALDQLGEHAIESLDATLPPVRKVDALLERLDAVPEHAGLHEALMAACEEAACDPQPSKKSAASRQADAASPDDDDDDAAESDSAKVKSRSRAD